MRLVRAVGQVDLHPAVDGLGQLELGDLVALGQVGIVVVLAGKDGQVGDFAVEGQPGLDGGLHRRPVDHRHGPGQPQADGADPCVGRRPGIVRGARAEHLGAGQQLGVDFHAHYGFVSCGHLRFLRFKKGFTAKAQRAQRFFLVFLCALRDFAVKKWCSCHLKLSHDDTIAPRAGQLRGGHGQSVVVPDGVQR